MTLTELEKQAYRKGTNFSEMDADPKATAECNLVKFDQL